MPKKLTVLKTVMTAVAVICFLWVNAQLQGQPLIDSLVAALPSMKEDSAKVKAYSKISQVYYQMNIKQSFPYVKQGLELAEKIGWKKVVAHLPATVFCTHVERAERDEIDLARVHRAF